VRNRAPEGYNSVSPYLMVDDIEEEVEFLRVVFQAEVKELQRNADGQIWHAEARIGDTIVMLGKVQRTCRPAGACFTCGRRCGRGLQAGAAL